MYYNRAGESGKPPPRSSRLFTMKNLWYFSTREGTDIGPYHSLEEANSGLRDFIEFIQLANDQTRKVFLQSICL